MNSIGIKNGVSPQGLRMPRLIHAILLLSASSLSVMITAVLGPSIPQMQLHFSNVSGAAYLVPLSVTIPMLVVAILSVLAGAFADRFGRKRLLIVSLFGYAVVGTAPLWVQSLHVILISRLFLGLFDAAIVTTSTVMIGDYYFGAQREKMLALTTTMMSVSAVVVTVIGGALGEHSWRTPYSVYSIGLVLGVLSAIYLWESKPSERAPVGVTASDALVVYRPRLLLRICAIGVLVGIAFIVVPIHLGYLMGSVGVTASQSIGIAAAFNSCGVVVGTLLFGWALASKLQVRGQLAVGTAVAGLGFVLMAVASTYWPLTAAAALNGVGAGILLPSLYTWNMRELPPAKRGFGTGAFMSSTFLGMAINPLIVVFLAQLFHGTGSAVLGIGSIMLGIAVLLVISSIRTPRVSTPAQV